jgi:hypothetical protein
MENSLVPPASHRPILAIAAFAAYGCCSLLYAAPTSSMTGVMVGQALLYFAVAAVLARGVPWAGWFAVGIATSGLVVDALFLDAWALDPGMALDAGAQAGLLCLALRARARVGTQLSTDRLTSTAPAPIGWTFALAAGVLPPAVMGALMFPLPFGCVGPIGLVPWYSGLELLVAALLAVWGLRLMARLRTAGLLPLAASLAMAAFATARTVADTLSVEATLRTFGDESLPLLQPGHYMALVAFAFAAAALVPLGPRFLRMLLRGR